MFDHLSLTASDFDRPQKFYDAILASLGVPRGNLRERYSSDCYAAFVRDPDGNRLEAVTRRPEEES